MSAEAFSRATECVERLPGPGTLERAMVLLAQAGVGLPRVRSWAVATAQSYGIWPYVARDFPRLLGIAATAAAEIRQLQSMEG
jgi:hypothetical protein